MTDQDFDVALALLMEDMEGDQGDRHEIFMRVKQMIDQMRAMGMPPPDDLVRLEDQLAAEFEEDARKSRISDPSRPS
ncbi:MAG: hypothetical protein ACTS3R_16005 [Inquilinaceae bacterium]